MDSYRFLSSYYDRFTDDVGYDRWAAYFEEVFARCGFRPELVLDLACGTGSISKEMAARGYEMIGVDASPEMLMQAMNNTLDCNPRPVFLNQRMERLDLYGTVQAALCCLDSVNYVTDPAVLREALRRVALFLEPDGVFIFDVNTRRKFDAMNGECYVREDEDVYCVWQAAFDGELCTYDFDIFELADDGRWERQCETHTERYYPPDDLTSMLTDAGFDRIELHPALSFDPLQDGEDRIFIIARKRNS